MLPSVLILGALAIAAAIVTRARPILEDDVARRHAARVLAVAVVVQGAHCAEEALTGFPERFPLLFGQAPMPFAVFAVVNLAWLVAWAASVPGLVSGRPAAFFAAWFLALAGVLNAAAHPLMAAAAGGYFPGLATSPFIGVAGAFLLVRLHRATRPAVGR